MNETQDRLEVDSRLSELSRIPPWVDALAIRLALPQETCFAIQLCLEEALANVVLHGYGQQPGHPIVIRFHAEEEHVVFAVEDKAPPFNPLKSIQYAGAARPVSLEFVEPGGNGIRLMRRFAGSIGYERLEDGNRVTMRFPIRPAAVDL